MGRVAVDVGTSALPFSCPSCGISSLAYVRASGVATAERDDLARTDRQANAARLLRCVPCPRCGATDTAHLRGLKLKAAGIGGGIGVGCAIAATLFTAPEEPLVFFIAMGACLLLFSLPIYLGLAASWWWGANGRGVWLST